MAGKMRMRIIGVSPSSLLRREGCVSWRRRPVWIPGSRRTELGHHGDPTQLRGWKICPRRWVALSGDPAREARSPVALLWYETDSVSERVQFMAALQRGQITMAEVS